MMVILSVRLQIAKMLVRMIGLKRLLKEFFLMMCGRFVMVSAWNGSFVGLKYDRSKKHNKYRLSMHSLW